ncbi:MAG: hypothetical protein KF693_18915 [Nitrospira sp.]|nr:hypothetical protein [Nitrospira sp.]
MVHCGSLPELFPLRQLRTWVAACVRVLSEWLQPSLALTQDVAVPGQNSLADVEEIELVYAGSQTVPQIIVRGRQAAYSFVLSSYRPPDERLDLLAQSAVGQALGACRATQVSAVPPLHVQMDHPEVVPFGWTWSLRHADKSLDALPFRTLHVRGGFASITT